MGPVQSRGVGAEGPAKETRLRPTGRTGSVLGNGATGSKVLDVVPAELRRRADRASASATAAARPRLVKWSLMSFEAISAVTPTAAAMPAIAPSRSVRPSGINKNPARPVRRIDFTSDPTHSNTKITTQ
ncbi:MAG: hypothetical protein CL798_09845 [Chromatiales bacterium]|nr:hypothetical protein [Chromatiales bacterium]